MVVILWFFEVDKNKYKFMYTNLVNRSKLLNINKYNIYNRYYLTKLIYRLLKPSYKFDDG